MIWNCPHCQNALTLLEDQVQEAWKFLRCLHCGGFSMVRKNPAAGAMAGAQSARRPVIKPSARRIAAAATAAPIAPKREIVPPPFRISKAKPPSLPEFDFDSDDFSDLADPDTIQTQKIPIPEPLPELSAPRNRAILTPILAATFATLVVVLGVRLHRLSQVTRYSEFAGWAQKGDAKMTETQDLVEAAALPPAPELPPSRSLSAPKTQTLIDQLRQQSFGTVRKDSEKK